MKKALFLLVICIWACFSTLPVPPASSVVKTMELWNDARHYSKRKWSVTEDSRYLTSFLNVRQEMITETRWKFYWEFLPFTADEMFADILPDRNLTITEKALLSLSSRRSERQRHFTELRDFWFNMPDEPIGHIIGDLTYLSKQGIPKMVITHGVLRFKETEFDADTLSGSFIIEMTKWEDGEKFKIGFKSQTYTSGSVTIEYVPLLPTAENLTATLVSGGSLVVDTEYVFTVYSTWDNGTTPYYPSKWGGRRFCDFSRSWTHITCTTNTTHRAINFTWTNNITNTDVRGYWLKFRPGDDPADQYYSWQGRIPTIYQPGPNCYYPGDNYVKYGIGNATINGCWYFRNESYYGNMYEYNDATHGQCGSHHDWNIPMYRCWESSGYTDMEDFYEADTYFTNNTYITKQVGPSFSATWYYQPQAQFYVNASLQMGSPNAVSDWNGDFFSYLEHISIYGNLYVFEGSLRCGEVYTGCAIKGSTIRFASPYRFYFRTEFMSSDGTDLTLINTDVRWGGAEVSRVSYYYGCNSYLMGTITMWHVQWTHMGGLNIYELGTTTYDLKDIFITSCHVGLLIEEGVTGSISGLEIHNCNYNILSPRASTMIAKDVSFEGGNYDCYFYRDSTLNLTDSNIDSSYLLWLYSNNYCYDKKNVTIRVLYQNGSAVPNALVTLNSTQPETWNYTSGMGWVWTFVCYEDPFVQLNTTTNSEGYVTASGDQADFIYRKLQGTITAGITKDTNETRYENCTLTISKTGFQTYESRVNVSDTTDWVITMLPEIVTETDPVARFNTTITTAYVNETIPFNGTMSNDPDGGSLTDYSWNFGDGNTTSGVYSTITHSWNTSGSYTLNLTVTDDEGATDWFVHTINVSDYLGPAAKFSFTPSNPRPQQTVSFDGSESSDDGAISSYAWTFGDGGSDTGNTTSHAFTTDGSFNVTLTVTDDDGETDSFSQTVNVLLGGTSTRIPRIVTVSLNPIEPLSEPGLIDVWWWKSMNAKAYVTVTTLQDMPQDVEITWWLTYNINSTVLASGNRTIQLDPSFYPSVTATIPFTIPLDEPIIPLFDETYSFHATVSVMQRGVGQQTSEEISMSFKLSSSAVNIHLTILVAAVIILVIGLAVAIQRLRNKLKQPEE